MRPIQSLAISGKSAWDILEKRYHKIRLIVQEHVKAILNLQSFSKCSHIQLRQLLDEVTNNLESLRNFQIQVDHWDAIVVPIILSKLDYVTRKEYELTLDDEVPTLKHCTEFLEKRCRTLDSLSIDDKPSVSRYTATTHNQSNHANREENKQHFSSNYREANFIKKVIFEV